MTLLKRLSSFYEYWYYQYILVTALYMLEAWEQKVFNCLLVAVIAMASYTAYVFLPGHVAMLARFCEYVAGGFLRVET